MNLVTGPWQEKMTEKADISVTIDDVLEDEDAVYLEVVDVVDLVVASHLLALVVCLKRILSSVFVPYNFFSDLLVLLNTLLLHRNCNTSVFHGGFVIHKKAGEGFYQGV